jgi:glycosyltransferase involved in cell wall biosynthesis
MSSMTDHRREIQKYRTLSGRGLLAWLVCRLEAAVDHSAGSPVTADSCHGDERERFAPRPYAGHMNTVRKLLIVARVTHYRHAGRFYAYTPYAREIDVWADLFPEVIVAGTLRDEPPPGDCTAFARPNVTVLPVADGGGNRLVQAARLPQMIWQLMRYMRRADAIHVRCPCDLGLLGVLLAPWFSRRLYAKYATQWLAFPGEPLAWRLQRALLRSAWWRGPVTVYGNWPNQAGHVVPFFTSMLTDEQIARARAHVATGKQPAAALRVLFVGRLSRSKNVDILLDAVAATRRGGLDLECTIVGEGPERPALAAQADRLGLNGSVRFAGGASFEQMLGWYEQADVLVLVSELEGWPKAIAEAMAFGLVCIGADRGLVPQMLAEGRGFVVRPGDARALAEALQAVAADPERSARMGQRAALWAQQYSLDGLREALRTLLAQRWGDGS